MENHNLWSLRLGFSTKQGEIIKKMGLSKFIDTSFQNKLPLTIPAEFESFSEMDMVDTTKEKSNDVLPSEQTKEERRKLAARKVAKNIVALKKMVLQRAYEAEYPLNENIALFWHNHFVSTIRSVKNAKWVFDHYATIHRYGIGNYKDLVKNIIATNAMVKYLNNDQNRKGKINENLGRELLELFTLGEGNYTEQDIKNTAKALAGLSIGKDGASYRPRFTDTSDKEIFGEKGNFKLDEVVEIIFKQEAVATFITRKILKWFIYDNPPEELVTKYGDYLRKQNYELEPFFKYLFKSEENVSKGGSMMKSPIKFACQVLQDLNVEKPNYLILGRFLKNQGMDIYEQVNVEGWQGGKDWLSSHIYLGRQGFVDALLTGGQGPRSKKMMVTDEPGSAIIEIKKHFYPFNSSNNASAIIKEMIDKHLSIIDEDFREELDKILVYDFDPRSESAQQNVNRLYQYITKSPEFQIV
jgi:uncharacterized protein (DUF1800 family)